jgi:16S rRNA (adenine1518-N6/adenine1519-N6)-dimethyltransferase
MKHSTPQAHGIPVKKQFGQHFLRNQSVIDTMIDAVGITAATSVFEIGCGDGFLTKSILQTKAQRLWIFEIDHDWATYVAQTYPDTRMTIHEENILDVDFSPFKEHEPWVLLANLPYQITFPILHLLKEHRDLLQEGVVMVQEEVAQKITKTGGRGYGFVSLYFQHFFSWKLLTKIPPHDFYPPPSVDSRLLYFKPRVAETIPDEEKFWAFIKHCFAQPRRTLRNNLLATPYAWYAKRDDFQFDDLRAQQMSMKDFLTLWQIIRPGPTNTELT